MKKQPSRNVKRETKRRILKEEGGLHPRAEHVTDALFADGDFFDPNDMVQVKYEMLRRVRVGDVSASRAAAEASFSRPTFYKAKEDFDSRGLPGLVPDKPGPRGPHKLNEQVLDFLRDVKRRDPTLRATNLAEHLRETLSVDLHPRTIERALEQPKKKHR